MWIFARVLEGMTWGLAEDLLDGRLVEMMERWVAERSEEDAAVALRAELATVDGRLDEYTCAWEAGALDLEMLTGRNRPLLEQKAELQRRLRDALGTEQTSAVLETLRGVSPATYVSALREQTADVQLQFLRGVWERAVIERGAVTFIYRAPGLEPTVLLRA
jgi:hypothetical protein